MVFNVVGNYYRGAKQEAFTKWLKRIVGRDDRFKHLLEPDYEDERLSFYGYFDMDLSPYQALQEEYLKYG